uniref:Uncharacterized protein n=1 Tax=Moniliophthora roreri TaxID=221103 RepID=A0A0W0FUA1_MONRR
MVSGEETVVYTDPGSRSLSHLHRCEILVASKRLYLAHTPKVQPPSEYAMGHPNPKLIGNLSTSSTEALSACCRSLSSSIGLGSKGDSSSSFNYLGASSYHGSGCAIGFKVVIANTRRPVDTPPITSSSSLISACTYMWESTRIQLQLHTLPGFWQDLSTLSGVVIITFAIQTAWLLENYKEVESHLHEATRIKDTRVKTPL